MFNKTTLQGLFAVLLSTAGLSGAADSLYTHHIYWPDFVATKVELPLSRPLPKGLWLVGWVSGLAPEDTLLPLESDLPTVLLLTPDQARWVVGHFPALLQQNVPNLRRWSRIDTASRVIVFGREHVQSQLLLPSAATLDWYIVHYAAHRLRLLTRRRLAQSLQTPTVAAVTGQRTIELLGADIAGQRVSLKVAGNVTFNGGVRFQDQEKSVTNFRADKRWDLEIDQTQRFDITGSVGDRIDVTIHQDSENDFEWENDLRITYKGDEDEILQRIEAGNISLALPGTQFATGVGGNSQGLFGLKAISKLGPLDLTAIASIQRSQKFIKSNTLTEALVIQDRYYVRNRYFFLDLDFRAGYFPLNSNGIRTFNANRVVKQLEVYRASSRTSREQLADTYSGTAYIDPRNPTAHPDSVEGLFQRLTLNVDYVPDYESGFIRLRVPVQDDVIIAVAYSLGSATGLAVESIGDVGYIATDSLAHVRLKLIKDRGQTASSPTWPLEFKNVYSLGGININPEGFDVKIFYLQGTSRTDRHEDGQTYLSKFGLDLWENESQAGDPDDIVDVFNTNIVKLPQGELHFPALLPFAYSTEPGVATADKALLEIYGFELQDSGGDFIAVGDSVPDMYYAPRKMIQPRFEIEIQQSSKGASTFNLGFNMVPGSETVKVNGQKLNRDVDYTIDPFSNSLTIKNMEQWVNPEVTIEYEENTFISFDKKVMLGGRIQWDLDDQSFLGATGLFYDQSILEERVDVGSEPIQNMLWDINGRLSREVPLLTRLLDRLPFIETDAISKFNIEGEIAQVLPNPNPLGEGFVDDFESAKRVTSPTLQYRSWHQSAPPVGKRLSDRRKMAWWNPFNDWPVQEIWPEREISAQANNLTTTIMVLDVFFEQFGDIPSDSMWAGITYPLLSSDYDQSQSKFFEIWLRGFKGRLHIDLGDISEDINLNGKIDTEDELLPGTTEGNGLLDEGEDVGLDGCRDVDEDGNGGCFQVDDDRDGTTDEEIFDGIDNDGDGLIDEDISALRPGALLSDPNGDNWSNSGRNDRNDFINGTEGNAATADGTRPDTEDLNGTGSFAPEVRNDYFTYSFLLDPTDIDFDPSLVGGRTFNVPPPANDTLATGWRLFRIPMADFKPADDNMSVSWDNVQNLRLWIDGLGNESYQTDITGRVQIAQIEFVGNEWEEIGLAAIDSDIFTKVDSTLNLAVTVVNTEDNPDYTSPPNVRGDLDRINNIRRKEQALALDFRKRGLPPGFKGAVTKEIISRSNESTFLAYSKMALYVHGESFDANPKLMTVDATYYTFWMRMGLGKAVGEMYYEIRKPLYPGWDERNHLDIDMDALAQLKLREEPDTTIQVDDEPVPGYYLGDMLVLIKGDPSLDRIGRYTTGVINRHPTRNIFGRVFLDEFRLSNVKRDKGLAVRLSGSLKLADLLTTSFNYNRTDADFHTVQQKIVRNPVTSERFQTSLQINPDRFLPKAWGVRAPVSVNYTRSLKSPKYIPGRDILAGTVAETKEKFQQRTEQMAVKFSFAKSVRSPYWLVRQTFDRITGGVTYQRVRSSNKEIKGLDARSFNTNLNYPIKFSDENYIRPFKVLAGLPWLGKRVEDIRIYYTPSQVQFAGTVTEILSTQVNRARADTTLERYKFNLKRSAQAQYRLSDRLSFTYSFNANSTLDELRDAKLQALQQFNTGRDLQINEQYGVKFDPLIFSWLNPKLNYQSQYQWTKNRPITDPRRGGAVAASGRLSANLNLTLKSIVEVYYRPVTAQTGPRARRNRRSRTGEQEAPEEIKNKRLEALLKRLHGLTSHILPITLSYSRNNRTGEPAVRGQPGYAYRLGLRELAGLVPDVSTTGGLDLSRISADEDFSWRSGLKLGKSINLNVSRSWKNSSTRSRSAETHNRSETFLMLNDQGDIGLPLVDWSLRWSGLEMLPLLKLLPWQISLQHAQIGSHVKNEQNQQAPVHIYKRNFQPLVGLTITFKGGLSSNIRASRQITLHIKDSGNTKVSADQISGTLTYQRRGGITIPIPFFRDFKLNNTVNFSLSVESSRTEKEIWIGEATEFVRTQSNRSLTIKPYITYTFSDKITGSFRYTYTEQEHYLTGKTITRNIGFDVNIAIRGS